MNDTYLPQPTGHRIASNRTYGESGATFAEWEGIIIIVLTVLMAIFGFAANALTMLVIRSSVALKGSAFNFVLVSLCAGDILSSVNSVVVVYRKTYGLRVFNLPLAMCKLSHSLTGLTEICTSHHILACCTIRLVAMKFPIVMTKFTPTKAKVMSAVIWAESILSIFIIRMFMTGIEEGKGGARRCIIGYGTWIHLKRTYTKYTAPILEHIPTAAIIICSVLIAYNLLRMRRVQGLSSSATRDQREKAALRQVAVIVLSYLVGHAMPIGYHYLDALNVDTGFTRRGRWIYWNVAYTLLRASECVNPLCYNYASSQLWTATKRYLFGLRLSTNSDSMNNNLAVTFSSTESRLRPASRTGSLPSTSTSEIRA